MLKSLMDYAEAGGFNSAQSLSVAQLDKLFQKDNKNNI